VLFGWVGWEIGQRWAFHLRLQAQQALCQVQIEANTRRGRTGETADEPAGYEPRWIR